MMICNRLHIVWGSRWNNSDHHVLIYQSPSFSFTIKILGREQLFNQLRVATKWGALRVKHKHSHHFGRRRTRERLIIIRITDGFLIIPLATKKEWYSGLVLMHIFREIKVTPFLWFPGIWWKCRDQHQVEKRIQWRAVGNINYLQVMGKDSILRTLCLFTFYPQQVLKIRINFFINHLAKDVLT